MMPNADSHEIGDFPQPDSGRADPQDFSFNDSLRVSCVPSGAVTVTASTTLSVWRARNSLRPREASATVKVTLPGPAWRRVRLPSVCEWRYSSEARSVEPRCASRALALTAKPCVTAGGGE